MFASYKNSYLQMVTSSVNPHVINRCVDKAMEQPTIDAFDRVPPFNRLTSNQPSIPIKNCDVTRRTLAFDRWALPKLRKELKNDDVYIVRGAINSVCDIVHDPEQNYRAIHLGFPSQLCYLLIHSEADIRERALIALTTISNLLDGKYAIVKNRKLLENLEICMNDLDVCVRFQAFSLTKELSIVWMTADHLLDNGFVEIIIDKLLHVHEIENKDVIALMLQSLVNLMYCNGKFLALECGLYDLLLDILDKNSNEAVIGWALKCISILTQTDEGRELALKHKLLKKYLYPYLFSKDEIVYQNAANAMLFATFKVKALVQAKKLPNLVDRLIELAHSVDNTTTQKYCMQVLANLTGHGLIKKQLLNDRVAELQAIPVGKDEHAQRVKEILLVDSLRFS